MKNPLDIFDQSSGINNKWINIISELEDLEGNKKEIKIELMKDGMPRALVFFDVDETLAHLDFIYSKAIQKIFSKQDPEELEKIYFEGFKLGNSFREFDRMRGIYLDGRAEWKDPEFYYRNRFLPNAQEIDESGNFAHNQAAKMLQEYGEAASLICDEFYKNGKDKFEKSKIQSIFLLVKMYSSLGMPMVIVTANAKVFADRFTKYLDFTDYFLDIATDEDIVGGGKEMAIPNLIKKLERKGIKIPKSRLIFVGDSLRGDIGICLVAQEKDSNIKGQGVLVLKDKKSLIEIKKQINEDEKIKKIIDSMEVYGFVTENVPLNEHGNPILLLTSNRKFLEKL